MIVQSDVQTTCWLPHFIGKKGKNIRRLEEDTGIKISVKDLRERVEIVFSRQTHEVRLIAKALVEHDIKGMLTKNRHKSNGHMSTI
jgi:predicted PilT family ATPase